MKKIGKIMGLSGAMLCSLASLTSCNKTGFKVGLLCLHGQTSTYDNNFIQAFEEACKDQKLEDNEYEIRTSVSEDYNQIKSAAKEWAEDGYSMIFADSFGHQEGMRDMAYKYQNTEFCHGTGTFSTTLKEGCSNFHNAFADIYKGRYLTGVVAGFKLAESYKSVEDSVTIGYVGAFPYAEVISGYTSFYLGVKKGFAMAFNKNNTSDADVDPNNAKNIVMKVLYTGSWYDYKSEMEAAQTLISKYDCKLISQHADSMGAPQACKQYKIPNVCYNISTESSTPDTYLVASKINWRPYFNVAIESVKNKYEKKEGKPIPLDFVGKGKIGLPDENDYNEASVQLLPYGKGVSKKAQEAVTAVKNQLENGGIKVFDTANFTISKNNNADYLAFNPIDVETKQKAKYGVWTKSDKTEKATVTNYWADVIDKGDYMGDTDVIATEEEDGTSVSYFNESGFNEYSETKLRSAPYFDLIIDGVEVVK